jgi:hypothetical protein
MKRNRTSEGSTSETRCGKLYSFRVELKAEWALDVPETKQGAEKQTVIVRKSASHEGRLLWPV